jgi:superfamily I DNA/RNA helicase
MKLNKKQQEVIEATEGPVLVSAGAGSGKTAVLIKRILRLMSLGVNESNICIVTFTNKAAYELEERLEKATHHKPEVMIGTFHSIALSLVREEIQKSKYTSGFEILSDVDAENLLEKAINKLDLDLKINDCARQISKFKYIGVGAERARHKNENMVNIYKEYQDLIQKYNRIDFDEIILEAIRILKCNPIIREKWSKRLEYIMIDEFQDTNTAQYIFLKTLFPNKNSNICCVGDDRQGIYSFRGANINIILNFEKDYDAKVILLEENYRSTKVIVNASNKVIEHNKSQTNKNTYTNNDSGSPISINKYETAKEEAAFIASSIKKNILKGNNYKDFAILVRANKLMNVIKATLTSEGIPYKLLEKDEKPFSVESVMSHDADLDSKQEEAVTLITVHSSKGLEYKCVFLIGLEQGCFPSRYMMKGPLLEEERRLLYVAMTRAKEKLVITYTASRENGNRTSNNKPSEFLIEIPKEFVVYNELAQKDFIGTVRKVIVLSKDKIEHPEFGKGRVLKVLELNESMQGTIQAIFGNNIEKVLDVQF